MRIEPASGFSRPMTNRSDTLFPVPLRPSTASVSPRPTLKLIPFRTVWLPNVFRTFSRATTDAAWTTDTSSCFIALSWAVAILVSRGVRNRLRKDNENELHQHNIGQNQEERGEHDRISRRATYAGSPPGCSHSLEAGLNELMKRERLNQSLCEPAS